MLLRVSDDLSRLTVLAEGYEQEGILGLRQAQAEPVEVVAFDEPTLLTDNAAIGRLAPHVRDAVFSLYMSFPRGVEYAGVRVDWTPWDYPRVWCPNIDTVFLARALARYLTPEVKRFAEVGTGSGFLTKLALQKAPWLERAVATDISLDAIRCAHDAVQALENKDVLALLKVDADAPSLGLTGQYDLLVTNPPYLPRPQERHDNPFEGLDLLAKLAREAEGLLAPEGRILTNISSAAGEQPLRWFEDAGFKVTAHETLRVPLKVNAVTSQMSPESHAWIKYLLDKDVLEQEPDYGDASGYRFWHHLQVFEIRRPG